MREITKQDVTILQAYSSEFGKLPAKMKKYQKAMETTERLLSEFAQTEYTASIFLDDQVTPVLEAVSGRLTDFSKSSYKVSVSVDMRKVYTDIYAAERRIRCMQLQPGYGSSGYMVPYAGGSIRGTGGTSVQTTGNEGFFGGAMSVGNEIAIVKKVELFICFMYTFIIKICYNKKMIIVEKKARKMNGTYRYADEGNR